MDLQESNWLRRVDLQPALSPHARRRRWRFAGWAGACAGRRATCVVKTCVVKLERAIAMRARFLRR